jgi:hypothetical protein
MPGRALPFRRAPCALRKRARRRVPRHGDLRSEPSDGLSYTSGDLPQHHYSCCCCHPGHTLTRIYAPLLSTPSPHCLIPVRSVKSRGDCRLFFHLFGHTFRVAEVVSTRLAEEKSAVAGQVTALKREKSSATVPCPDIRHCGRSVDEQSGQRPPMSATSPVGGRLRISARRDCLMEIVSGIALLVAFGAGLIVFLISLTLQWLWR